MTEAQLTQPGRIDGMARQLGLAEPQPGQVVHAATHIDTSAPVLAQSMRRSQTRQLSTDPAPDYPEIPRRAHRAIRRDVSRLNALI